MQQLCYHSFSQDNSGMAFLQAKCGRCHSDKKKKKHLSCCPYNANYLAETKKFSFRCQYWVYMTSFVQMRGKSGFLRIKFLWSTS